MPRNLTDVVICGAGPVGLLVALGLAQQGIDTLLIEKRQRQDQERSGRACTLYPRTLELLEQLDVTSEMAQVAFTGRTYAVYKDGKRQTRQTWQSVLPYMESSFHNYIMNIRQKMSESIFAKRYAADHGKGIQYGSELRGFKVDTSLSDGCNITVSIVDENLKEREIRCKYLVGADGGQSTVRSVAEVAMEGNDTTYKWVRIDGLMRTNMPEPNLMFASLETKAHGNVLWLRLDNDAHRIGFALTPRLQEKYPSGPTMEQAIEEAKQCLSPFELDIERVDWWTCYSIKQKVAETMLKDKFVLLAGDAAHTHSSAFAQGMNTGVHDATNLIWKLAGTLKGWYGPGVLATYESERREAAKKLISIDRLAAAAVSGDVPLEFKALGLSLDEATRSIFQKNLTYTVGLGISYEASILNQEPHATTLVSGTRSPDALLHTPGPALPVRLHDILHRYSKGRWSLLVFAGYPHQTKKQITSLRSKLTSDGGLKRWSPIYQKATVMVGITGCVWDTFDGPAIGNLYFDKDGMAHSRFGVYPDNGAILVIRPDGIFAFAAALDELDVIEEYFQGLVLDQSATGNICG